MECRRFGHMLRFGSRDTAGDENEAEGNRATAVVFVRILSFCLVTRDLFVFMVTCRALENILENHFVYRGKILGLETFVLKKSRYYGIFPTSYNINLFWIFPDILQHS